MTFCYFILLWKSYPPDACWARYRVVQRSEEPGTKNQEPRTLNKQQSQGKSQCYSSILYSSKLDSLSSAAIHFLLHTPAPNVTCGHPNHIIISIYHKPLHHRGLPKCFANRWATSDIVAYKEWKGGALDLRDSNGSVEKNVVSIRIIWRQRLYAANILLWTATRRLEREERKKRANLSLSVRSVQGPPRHPLSLRSDLR